MVVPIQQYNEQIRNPQMEGVLTRTSGACYHPKPFLNKTGGAIPYGLGLVWNNTTKKIELPSVTGQEFVGIAYRADIYEEKEKDYGGGIVLKGYPVDQLVNYTAMDEVPVVIDTDFDEGNDLYLRFSANGAGKEVPGRFSVSDDGGTCDLVPRARIMSSGNAGEIAIVRIWG